MQDNQTIKHRRGDAPWNWSSVPAYFLAVLLVALFLGGLSFSGITLVALLLSTIFYFWTLAKDDRPVRLALSLFVISTIAIFVAPSLDDRSGHPRQTVCANNLRNLGQAVQQFVTTRDYFPSAATMDRDGTPLHSWRTIILPNLDRQDFFDKCDLKQPWNSPKNKFLMGIDFEMMHCPSDTAREKGETGYVAIIGPGTIWERGKKISLTDIKDGPANTILFVEMAHSGILWAEPRDIDLENLPPGITTANLLTSLSNHPGGFLVVCADASVHFVPNTVPWSTFMALLTINGKEKIVPPW
jgi:hypothetical protein